MALRVHRSASAAALAAALSDALRRAPADAFAADETAVPERGVERWLAQQLSLELGAGAHRDGVSANIRFPSPAQLLDGALAEASPEHAAAVEAWRPETAVWPLVDLIDGLPDNEVFASLHHYLRQPSRRYALAAKVARLFDTYGRERPELIAAWHAGQDEAPADLLWQPHLWRRLREQLGPSPAELHEAAIQALRQSETAIDGRLCIYGLTRLTRARLDILAAIAERQDVHLFINHPGEALWNKVIATHGMKRRDDLSAEKLNHPLLISLSRDVREFQQRLTNAVPAMQTRAHDEPAAAGTLLHRLQRDLHDDSIPATKDAIAAHDRSVQIHACHGAARQVEVLREAILQIMMSDPTLEPRDVIVMCPDVEHYAPLIKAVFDTDSHPGGRLKVSIADRSLQQTNPLLGLATRLLELAGSRLTGPQVLDLAGHPSVREQFGLTDDDLEQLRAWTIAAHVRWGMDGDTRDEYGLGGLSDGTWRSGLDRLLAGIAFGSAQTPYNGLLPVGGIDSTDIDLVGRFAELLDRLDASLETLRTTTTAADWLVKLQEAVLQLGDTPRDGSWQVAQLDREFGSIREAASRSEAMLTLTDVRVLLESQLRGRPTRSSFRTGAVTVCTMTPMRSVPHRVVCLLGLDDTAFPRHGLPDGDDILGRDPMVGERDPRSEDRQLFLDAILAAEDYLVITYSGADVRTGAELPPAVPVGELLDALDLTAEDAREHVVTRHTLQPFDARNFTDGALTSVGPFSFDRSAFKGATAMRDARADKPAFLAAPLEKPTPGVVTLRQLKEFLENPTKTFLRQRLEVIESTRDEQPSDAIALELDSLEQWGVADRILRARMGGIHRNDAAAAEAARGALPPGAIGDKLLASFDERVTKLAHTAGHFWRPQEDFSIDLPLAGGWSLSGSVARRENTVLHVGYSTLGAKQRMRAWVDLLAITAAYGGDSQAAVVGRKKEEARLEIYGPVSRDYALKMLQLLMNLREIGLRTPIPLNADVASAYATDRHHGGDTKSARAAAAKEWTTQWGFDKADRDVETLLVWGADQPFSMVTSWVCPLPLGLPPIGETNDFGQLACTVWLPLLEAEAQP